MSELAAAANRTVRVSCSIWYPRFASLAAAAIQTAMSEPSEDEHGHVDRSLRHLASELRSLFPTAPDFPDDPGKVEQIAGVFTALVDKYGE